MSEYGTFTVSSDSGYLKVSFDLNPYKFSQISGAVIQVINQTDSSNNFEYIIDGTISCQRPTLFDPTESYVIKNLVVGTTYVVSVSLELEDHSFISINNYVTDKQSVSITVAAIPPTPTLVSITRDIGDIQYIPPEDTKIAIVVSFDSNVVITMDGENVNAHYSNGGELMDMLFTFVNVTATNSVLGIYSVSKSIATSEYNSAKNKLTFYITKDELDVQTLKFNVFANVSAIDGGISAKSNSLTILSELAPEPPTVSGGACDGTASLADVVISRYNDYGDLAYVYLTGVKTGTFQQYEDDGTFKVSYADWFSRYGNGVPIQVQATTATSDGYESELSDSHYVMKTQYSSVAIKNLHFANADANNAREATFKLDIVAGTFQEQYYATFSVNGTEVTGPILLNSEAEFAVGNDVSFSISVMGVEDEDTVTLTISRAILKSSLSQLQLTVLTDVDGLQADLAEVWLPNSSEVSEDAVASDRPMKIQSATARSAANGFSIGQWILASAGAAASTVRIDIKDTVTKAVRSFTYSAAFSGLLAFDETVEDDDYVTAAFVPQRGYDIGLYAQNDRGASNVLLYTSIYINDYQYPIPTNVSLAANKKSNNDIIAKLKWNWSPRSLTNLPDPTSFLITGLPNNADGITVNFVFSRDSEYSTTINLGELELDTTVTGSIKVVNSSNSSYTSDAVDFSATYIGIAPDDLTSVDVQSTVNGFKAKWTLATTGTVATHVRVTVRNTIDWTVREFLFGADVGGYVTIDNTIADIDGLTGAFGNAIPYSFGFTPLNVNGDGTTSTFGTNMYPNDYKLPSVSNIALSFEDVTNTNVNGLLSWSWSARNPSNLHTPTSFYILGLPNNPNGIIVNYVSSANNTFSTTVNFGTLPYGTKVSGSIAAIYGVSDEEATSNSDSVAFSEVYLGVPVLSVVSYASQVLVVNVALNGYTDVTELGLVVFPEESTNGSSIMTPVVTNGVVQSGILSSAVSGGIEYRITLAYDAYVSVPNGIALVGYGSASYGSRIIYYQLLSSGLDEFFGAENPDFVPPV